MQVYKSRIRSLIKDIAIAPLGAVVMSVLCVALSSCSGQDKKFAAAITERDSLPVLETRGVNTLISDSGVVRYRITAPLWQVFDRKTPSRWAFEEGVYLETFDENLVTQASIQADTAYYYDEQRLWELDGNVQIKNLKGEEFSTQQMFWNQGTQRVYSDKFIRIRQTDRIITGHGFESNQQMTIYRIFRPEGIFYVDDDSAATDSIASDSASVDAAQTTGQ